tara:strand:- start:644 stop:1249 length:606 start_codon:yes stop_codon:yes gene_type:complete
MKIGTLILTTKIMNGNPSSPTPGQGWSLDGSNLDPDQQSIDTNAPPPATEEKLEPIEPPEGFEEIMMGFLYDDDRDTVDLDAPEDVLYPFGKEEQTKMPEYTTEQAQLYDILTRYIPRDSAIRQFGVNNLNQEVADLLRKCRHNAAPWIIITHIGHDKGRVLKFCEALVAHFKTRPDIRGKLKADLHEPMCLFGVEFEEQF